MTATATTPPARLTCPKCGGVAKVHTTRHPAPGLVVRYRRCVACRATSATESRTRVEGGELVTVERPRPGRAAG